MYGELADIVLSGDAVDFSSVPLDLATAPSPSRVATPSPFVQQPLVPPIQPGTLPVQGPAPMVGQANTSQYMLLMALVLGAVLIYSGKKGRRH